MPLFLLAIQIKSVITQLALNREAFISFNCVTRSNVWRT